MLTTRLPVSEAGFAGSAGEAGVIPLAGKAGTGRPRAATMISRRVADSSGRNWRRIARCRWRVSSNLPP